MPMPKYRIPPADALVASAYLRRRIRAGDVDYRRGARTAPEAFDVAMRRRNDAERLAEALNTWCETHLGGEDWERLKATIRKRRERDSRGHLLVTITISTKAHALMAKLCKRDKLTLSQGLEKYLGDAWRKRR